MAFLVIALATVIVFPSLFAFFGWYSQKKIAHESYSFRNYFPFELFKNLPYPYLVTLRALEGLALLSGMLPAAYALTLFAKGGSSETTYLVAVALASFLPAISFLFLTIIDVSFPKQHLFLFFVFGAGELLKKGMLGFYLVSAYKNWNDSSILAMAIILFVAMVPDLVMLVNPALKRWDRLVKTAEKDGTVSYSRPKRFVLAYSEWMGLLVSSLGDIVALVGIYLANASV